MNILPKKRWHVRTKENIARVRRDEAKAAEEEKAKQDRIKLAERESRREFLLERSRKNITSQGEFIPLKKGNDCEETYTGGHINFFKELEDGTAELKQTNKEHDKEKKQEQEKYEKQIGYLTYLGQDTNEALGKKNWYEVVPDRSESEKSETNLKSKIREDPLELIKKYTSIGKTIDDVKKIHNKAIYKSILHNNDSSSRKRKRRDSSSSDIDTHSCKKSKHNEKKRKEYKSKRRYESNSESSKHSDDEAELEKKKRLEVLRLERMKRERQERRRTDEFLAKIRGEEKKTVKETSFKPKYNSQFNPELAKQNYDKNR